VRGKLDILVVDDQPGVRYLLDIILKEEGHNVILAEDGLEAVEAVRAHKPDLVFMDVRMPKMCGLEALGKIKIMSPETEVVLMTAFISDETVRTALEKGAFYCFTKPFDVDLIKSFIANFSCWLSQNKKKVSAVVS
jgi:two-component system response regulator (stage 0 sporulation protein F)